MATPLQSAYTDWSATYDTDRNLTRDLDAMVTRSSLSGRRYRATLELGCGTGKNTSFLLSVSDVVQGLDFSEGMLAQARAKNLGGNVTFTQADLTGAWPVGGESVDLITCSLVLEHIEDLGPIFRQAAEALRRGGRFFVSELHPFKQYLGSKARYEREGVQVFLASFTHHVSDFFRAAGAAGLTLGSLEEPRHAEDGPDAPPRLACFLFGK